MINNVYLIDCMEFMKNCDDYQYDLAIVDPPYGICNKKMTGLFKKNFAHFNGQDGQAWDIRPTDEYFKELFRISKNQVVFGMQYFISSLYDTKCAIVWDKKTGKNYFSDCELIWTSFDGACKKYTQQWCGAFKETKEKNRTNIHPTQKPIELYEYLLKKFAKPGQKIFDSHSGSGSHRIACFELGFDFEGCELNEKYYNDQEERFLKWKAEKQNEFYLPDSENLLFKNIDY